MSHRGKKRAHHYVKTLFVLGISICFIVVGFAALWVATLKMPDLTSFQNRKVIESTKIYDRTGTILLYDTGKDAKRTAIPLEQISTFVQDATITQQVVKNSLLTKDKTITRKIKEWVIAVKLTRVMSKQQILETYLNDTSYGGTIFGIEEASRAFFGRPAKDISLAQAAYLAAIPQAPTYYSPYGTHREALDIRQKIVLKRMKDLGKISQIEYDSALGEKVQFLTKNDSSIRAPHFVMYVKDAITQKYGEEMITSGGLRIITTLDFDLQQKAEEVVDKFSPSLETNFNASNTAMVAIDPKTGDILTMVGSRDYFSTEIDGNFNITLARRQPGSTFKPFVYATAFKKGYTPETALFDVKTEFSTQCTVEGKPKNESDDQEKICYSPDEYDNLFPGPMTMREALAHSRNIPAVKTLYLAGIGDSLQTAEDMGITELNDPNRYGLTLVLGGGEVSLLELTSAYGVFANDGLRNPHRSILRVEDSKGTILESVSDSPIATLALEPEIARQISNILSAENIRMDSLKPIGESVGRQVAKNFPPENFRTPPPPPTDSKPVLRGVWMGGVSYWKDSVSGKLATEYTPTETKKEVVFNNVHTILQWINKDNPRGALFVDPKQDSQYDYWEYGVRKWFDDYQKTHPNFKEVSVPVVPNQLDDVHTPDKAPRISFISPLAGSTIKSHDMLLIRLQATTSYPPQKTEVYLNGKYVLTSEKNPLNISFFPADVGGLIENNTISVTLYDSVFNKTTASTTFSVL